MTENKDSGFWIGFFVGGFFGALLLVLLGTKEGKRLATRLLEHGEFLEEDLESKIRKLQEKGEELLSQAQNVKEEAIQKVENVKGEVTSDIAQKMDTALTRVEEIQQQGVGITQEVHRFFKKDGKPLSS